MTTIRTQLYKITKEQLESELGKVEYPGATIPGIYTYDEKTNRFTLIAHTPTPVLEPEISSGLGIGGKGSDDYNIYTERPSTTIYRPHKCGRGQRYDERCAKCHRVTTVCNDCELCSRCHEKD